MLVERQVDAQLGSGHALQLPKRWPVQLPLRATTSWHVWTQTEIVITYEFADGTVWEDRVWPLGAWPSQGDGRVWKDPTRQLPDGCVRGETVPVRLSIATVDDDGRSAAPFYTRSLSFEVTLEESSSNILEACEEPDVGVNANDLRADFLGHYVWVDVPYLTTDDVAIGLRIELVRGDQTSLLGRLWASSKRPALPAATHSRYMVEHGVDIGAIMERARGQQGCYLRIVADPDIALRDFGASCYWDVDVTHRCP